MQGKKQLGIFATVMLSILLLGNSIFWGCAGTSGQKGPSIDEQAAIRDSLFREHKNELRKWWSFGHEPYKQQDYNKAKIYFKRVAEKDTSGIYQQNLYQYLGNCYLRMEPAQPDSAEWAYKVGLERNPDNTWFYNILGYVYKGSDRHDEAIEMYTKLTEMEPDTAQHYIELGQLYVLTDRQEEAIEAFQNAIRLNPNDIESQERLNALLSQSGDDDAVIAHQEAMVEQSPENTGYRLDLAKSYYRISAFEKAIAQLEIVKTKDPGNKSALEILGDCYQQLDKFSAAAGIYEEILKKNPEDKKNLCSLALTQASLGRYRIARQTVNKALRIDSDYGLAYLTRGFIYQESADKCVDKAGGKITYSDKLVYKMAFDEYNKAKRDYETKSEAEKRMKYLESLIPTSEDKFFHKNQKAPEGACYQWI